MSRDKVGLGFRMEANDRGVIFLRAFVMSYYILCPTETNFFQQYHQRARPSTALAGHEAKLFASMFQDMNVAPDIKFNPYSTCVLKGIFNPPGVAHSTTEPKAHRYTHPCRERWNTYNLYTGISVCHTTNSVYVKSGLELTSAGMTKYKYRSIYISR